ncbi:hypothetical protein M8818_006114 [Zalaria obscura]|uniref:Uncharacterized protein n=1 Tax=Zalaria obscura TaxID=2024903 RepID=A0ACC3S706_9PEZI
MSTSTWPQAGHNRNDSHQQTSTTMSSVAKTTMYAVLAQGHDVHQCDVPVIAKVCQDPVEACRIATALHLKVIEGAKLDESVANTVHSPPTQTSLDGGIHAEVRWKIDVGTARFTIDVVRVQIPEIVKTPAITTAVTANPAAMSRMTATPNIAGTGSHQGTTLAAGLATPTAGLATAMSVFKSPPRPVGFTA